MNLRQSLSFFLGLSAVIIIFLLIQSSGVLDRFGFIAPDRLNTDRGKINRNDALFREISSINFPGYEEELATENYNLSEESEFATPTQLLSSGEQIKLNIPRFLPFELALQDTPQAVILGTSMTREGIRPDVLAQGTNLKKILNFSIGGARFTTIELIVDYLSNTHSRGIELLVIGINDVSFFKDEGGTKIWTKNLLQLEKKRTFIGKLDVMAGKLFGFLPNFRRNQLPRLSQPFIVCDDQGKIQSLLKGDIKPVLSKYTFEPQEVQIRALERIYEKSKRFKRVIFLEMPASSFHDRVMSGTSHRSIMEEVIGDKLISGKRENWDLKDSDFFGSSGGKPCKLDPWHLNPAAAIKYTALLTHLLK